MEEPEYVSVEFGEFAVSPLPLPSFERRRFSHPWDPTHRGLRLGSLGSNHLHLSKLITMPAEWDAASDISLPRSG